MANKISTIFDLDDRGFKSTLKGIGTSVGQTDGMLGKLKAGAKGTFDGLKQYAGEAALGAGAALVAFSVKAVAAFTNTAKAALDLSTSTGLMVEDASRWLGVADDFQVSAEAMATGLGKITKTMDSTKWAQYGIDTRDAGGKARDVNDILLDTFDMLSKVTNKTDQARIGQQLFGKGYQSLTPILGHTRAEYEKMLGAVEKGQVITEAEAKKAERMRLAQDQLSDALKEITLSWGQVVASMAPAVTESAEAVATFLALAEQVDDATEKLGGLKGVLDIIAGGRPDVIFGKMVDVFTTFTPNVEAVTEAMTETNRETRELATGFGEVVDAEVAATDAAAEYKRNADNTARSVKQNIDEMIGKWDELTGDVEDDKAWLTLQGQFDELRIKAEEAYTAAATGAEDAEAKGRDYQIAVKDLILDTINYGKTVADLPPEKLVAIKAAIDMGDIDRAEEMLAILTRNRNVSIGIVAHGGAGYNQLGTPSYASGTARVPGALGQPMMAVVHGGERITSAGGNGGGGPITVNVYLPVGSNGDTMIREIEKWRNRNGNTKWMAS